MRPRWRCGDLTFLQHPHFEAFHEAAGLAGLTPPFRDLTLVGGRAAVLDVPCNQTQTGLPGTILGSPPAGWGLTSQTYHIIPHVEVPIGQGFSKCSEVLVTMFPKSLKYRDPNSQDLGGPGSHSFEEWSPTGLGHQNSLRGCPQISVYLSLSLWHMETIYSWIF